MYHHGALRELAHALFIAARRTTAKGDDAKPSVPDEGMAADFEELFRRDKSETGTPAGRAVPTVSIEDAPRVALTLTGIIWHEKAPLAFVNDTLVGVGDHVGDAELVRIEKARVVVRHRDGQKRVLELVDADER